MSRVATLEEAKQFCNNVREAGGVDALDDLLPAIPEDPSQCLIAINVNFDSQVNIYGTNKKGEYDQLGYDQSESVWKMETDGESAKLISEKLGLPITITTNRYDEGETHRVALPAKIGRLAQEYDRWAAAEIEDVDPDSPFANYVNEETVASHARSQKEWLEDGETDRGWIEIAERRGIDY